MATKAVTKKVSKEDKEKEEKTKEMKGRAHADQKGKETVLGLYDKKLARAEEARNFASEPYFQKVFKALKSSVDGAYKRLQDACKLKPSKLEVVADLAPYTKAMTELKVAVKELDTWTYPARRDCLELESYCDQFSNDKLFEKEMTKIAVWDHEKGAVRIEPRK